MYKTAEQQEIMNSLIIQYGTPDHIKHECTNEPYGLVWLHWRDREYDDVIDRNLFIKPDGTRLTWNIQ